MKRTRLMVAAAIAAQGCFLASDPYVAPTPADAAGLEARVRADTADADAVARLAALWLAEGRTGEARTLLERAEAATPGDPAVPLLLAVAQERMGAYLPAASGYERYRRSRTGRLAARAEERLLAIGPSMLRERARQLVAESVSDSRALDPRVVAVLPLASSGQDEVAAAEAAAVAALVARDLAAQGWRVIDDALLRVVLDEMLVEPTGLADLALGVEIGRRFGAGRVVQGMGRRVSLTSTEWDLTVLTIEPPTSLRVDHVAIEAGVGTSPLVQQRMAALVRAALSRERPSETFGTTFTLSSESLAAFGAGLRAMDRGDIDAADRAFGVAAASDSTFREAVALAARTSSARRALPLDSLIQEAARVGELQRAVLALRAAPASAHDGMVARVGEAQRPLISDVLGLDALAGEVLLDVTLTVPGAGP